MLQPGEVAALAGGLLAFLVVAGWAAFRWRVSGRDPRYLDDASILVAAPPPGMTAATATVITGGPHGLAFLAGLLDLASRDEIAFRDEGSGASSTHPVGIEIHGGPTSDPRVLLNRRRPIGEAEAWLLTFLKEYAYQRVPGHEDGSLDVDEMEAMLRFLAFVPGMPGESFGGSLSQGMFSGSPDVPSLIASAEARAGHPISGRWRASLERLGPLLATMRDPAAILADPTAWADRIEASLGQRPTDRQIEQVQAWARRQVSSGATPGATPGAVAGAAQPAAPDVPQSDAPGAPGSGAPSTYIPAARAAQFQTPMGFGTYLQTYARRHGWTAGLAVVSRLKWRALAVVEAIAGLAAAALGGQQTGLLTGVGLGIVAGGVATWFIAPAMAARTPEGAMVAAQLAAYRRTLQATFGSAASLDDVAMRAGMSWLETPDQVVVWGVALGLQGDVERLLDRSGTGSAGATAATPGHSRLPAWWRGAPGPATPAAAMFAGIEGIGRRPVTPVPQKHEWR